MPFPGYKTEYAGIGLRSAHYKPLLEEKPAIAWLEVHPENYFGGGRHNHLLKIARETYPVSFHGIGLSLGSSDPVNAGHVESLKRLIGEYDPIRVSDHASWSASGNAHMNDLLPLPYTQETLDNLCRNIDIVQKALGRSILIENPSTYLSFDISTMSEAAFLAAAVARTGCGLLLDINNIIVQAHNHGFDADEYLSEIPADAVGEMHLAGHVEEIFPSGTLLVDTHSEPVPDKVWALFERTITLFGPRPTLIEWDRDLPAFHVLLDEAMRAEEILIAALSPQEALYEAA
jgi:uncharacterized protein